MNKKVSKFGLRRTVLMVAAVAAFAWAALPNDAAAQDTYRMRIQAAVPSGSMSFEMLENFAERLDRMSNGRLKVRVLGAGAIVPSNRILDSVNNGTIEAGFAWPQFWAGKHPATALFSNTPVWPMAGLDMLTHFSWFYEGGGQELYQELLEEKVGLKAKSFFVTPSGWQSLGWFNKPIESIEDFRNTKYRSPPGLAGEIFAEAGIPTVTLMGEEIIPAAERGVIEAAEWISPVEDVPFGFPEAFDRFYLTSVHQFIDVGEVVISQQFWDGLPPDLQAMIEVAAQATIIETFNNDIKRNSEMLAQLEEKYGVTVSPTPPDIHAALVEAANRVLQKHSGENEYYKKVVEHQKAYARMVIPWWGRVLNTYQDLSKNALIKVED